ncbi:MAG TPA: SpoIID/LytB domain-containing protein [Gaiellaceae bacterium]|nr:SpoIID/LytB domain-containing protein [Gaiellaceae bacterium]
MRRLLPAAIALVVALACAAAAQSAVTFVFKGKGWGHGIGLSQYGAQGFAQNGRTYGQILGHFYQGSTLGSRSATIRVRLAAGRSFVNLGSAATFKAGAANVGGGAAWRVTAPPGGGIRLTRSGTTRNFPSPTTFRPGTASLALNGVRYRGTIVVRRSGSAVWALNVLGLDPYVKGVVPQEMPTSWHAEALKAQAVAARSYALAAGGHCSWFGTSVMCPDTSDQVYGGRSAEAASSNAAVDATARRVVLSGGAVATTFFFSTSGGKTASIAHEWGSAPQPYLVSVPDPFDTISPHHVWGPGDPETDCSGTAPDCVWSGAALKRKMGTRVPAGLTDLAVTARNGSSRVSTVRANGAGTPKTFTGATARSVLGLRSTWFTIGVLRLGGAGTIEWGKSRVLPALVRNLSNVHLQRRPVGGTWANVRAVQGTTTITATPSRTTFYRLRNPSAGTAPVRVAVRPQLRFTANQPPGALRGTLRPVQPGRTIQVQRRTSAGGWRTVDTAVVNGDGVWRAVFNVTPGSYRAYMASPGGGLVPGAGPTVTVVAR